MKTDLCEMTATELSAAYKKGAASPVEAIKRVLERSESAGKTLNAFCCFDEKSALASAQASEKRWREGTPKSPLDGVPVSVKDNIATDGMPTRFGSAALPDDQTHLPDSPSVARLREAGAVIFSKTCLPDFAHKIVTDSPLTGVTRNPWNLAHTPGGSSGGASAAVAARIGPLALGTDGGASIRVPASFAGIFGLKPSFGRVPHYPRGAFGPLSHVGPMTLTVEDAALMMNAITQPDSRDWYSLPYQPMDYLYGRRVRLKSLRVAFSERLGLSNVSVAADVRNAVRSAAEKCAELGAIVEDADPPAIQRCREIHGVMWTSFSARVAKSLGERRKLLDPSMQRLAEIGETIPREAYVDATIARGEVGKEINGFFENYDIVLAPVYHTTAPALAEYEKGEPPLPTLTNWCNQTGLPAASVYCGMSPSGLPIGLQVIGGRFADTTVLSVCHAFEQVFGAAPRPKIEELEAGHRT
jgi:aspartyl-tRNA(Asn)/glutamyl-tRNA(Gln) amidotransferase subunit A